MVVSPLDVDVNGLEDARDSVNSEIQLYKERYNVVPNSYKVNIKVKSSSPYNLSEKLSETNVLLTLWLGSERNDEFPDTSEEPQKKDTEQVIREMGRFHEMELENLCFGVGDFGGIADRLDMVGGFFGGEGFPVEYFKLGGTVEEETFILAVDRLKNRITPGISLKPPKQKPKLKINIEYEPAPVNNHGYLLRTAIFNPGHRYSKDTIKEIGNEIRNVFDKYNLPTPDIERK